MLKKMRVKLVIASEIRNIHTFETVKLPKEYNEIKVWYSEEAYYKLQNEGQKAAESHNAEYLKLEHKVDNMNNKISQLKSQLEMHKPMKTWLVHRDEGDDITVEAHQHNFGREATTYIFTTNDGIVTNIIHNVTTLELVK